MCTKRYFEYNLCGNIGPQNIYLYEASSEGMHYYPAFTHHVVHTGVGGPFFTNLFPSTLGLYAVIACHMPLS